MRPLVLVAVAIVVLVPSVDLVRQVGRGAPTPAAFDEDAYYTFAVARNLAHGHGLSADGAHATSGFQPLWTIAVAPAFWLPGRGPFYAVAVVSVALWVLAAGLFARLLLRLLEPRRAPPQLLGPLFALLFLSDPDLRDLFLNGLETGLAVVLALVVVGLLLRWPTDGPPARADAVVLGFVLGALALARVDNLAIVGAALLYCAWVQRRSPPGRTRAVLAGAVAAALVIPWAVYALTVAGSPLPQSGLALQVGRALFDPPFADRIRYGLAAAARAVGGPLVDVTILPRPSSTARSLAVLVVGGALGGVLVWRRAGRRWQPLGFVAVALVALYGAYVLTSTATYFYPRYFVDLRVLVLGLWCAALVVAVERLSPRRVAAGSAVAAVALALLVVWRDGDVPTGYLQAQASALDASHVPSRCGRIGMFESGRTQYAFGDRVVNLDGVTNEAARAAIDEGTLPAYLREQRLDVLYTATYWLGYLDTAYPGWRDEFTFVPDPTVAGYVYSVRHGEGCLGSLG